MYCENNFDDLLKFHDQFPEDYKNYIFLRETKRKIQLKKKILFDNKQYELIKSGEVIKCTCGENLRIIPGYNFAGCPNYLDKSQKHLTYNFRDIPEIKSKNDFDFSLYPIGKNYLNLFKIFNHIPRNIMPSIIFKFVIRIGNKKPYADINEDYYNVVVDNNHKSKNEENIVFEILKKQFPVVLSQPNFEFEYNGKRTNKIPDFVCSNTREVIIFEVKKSKCNADIKKLDLYEQIINEYLKEHNDKRLLKSFIVFYEDDCPSFSIKNSIHVNNLRS